MGKKHPNWRRIKIYRTYSTDDIARDLKVHKSTVRNWMRSGLRAVDGGRPCLFRGAVIIDFLRARRSKARRPLQVGEIYCLACREAKIPAGEMADLTPVNNATGNLCGICPDCDRLIFRRVSMAKLVTSCGSLAINLRQAPLRIGERG